MSILKIWGDDGTNRFTVGNCNIQQIEDNGKGLPKLELPIKNYDYNCWSISLKLILESFDLWNGVSVDQLNEMIGKEKWTYTIPWFLCKVAQDYWLDVQYYSKAFGSNYNKKGTIIERYIRYMKNNLNEEKLEESLNYIKKEKILNETDIDLDNMQTFLYEGKRIMTLISWKHYVVVSNIDENFVYYLDSEQNEKEQKLSRSAFKQLLDAWYGLKEIITISKHDVISQ